MHQLPVKGTEGGSAMGINSAGDVVGAYVVNNVDRAALWHDRQLVDLNVLPEQDTVATAINDHGQITIRAVTSPGRAKSYIWTGGNVKTLGDLGGPMTLARAINNSGQVVGEAVDTAGIGHPATWEDGKISVLPLPVWAAGGIATDVNDSGQIVGNFENWDLRAAFLYDGGTMYDIRNLIPPDSGWDIYEVDGINDNGVMIGSGLRDGQSSALLLVPLPEPSGAGLLALGLFLLRRRRRRCKQKIALFPPQLR